MLQKLSNLRLPIDFDNSVIARQIQKKLGNYRFVKIDRLSLDSRRKNDIHYVASVIVDGNPNHNLQEYKEKLSQIKQLVNCKVDLSSRPIIIGSGPCGMFAGLVLAHYGLSPIIFEGGDKVENRSKIVTNFNLGGDLCENTNIQFGEGGAGTFSDGKLNTGISSEYISVVLNEFVRHGAKEDILYSAKPHIGTDILKNVVKNIRNTIVSLGGEYKFNHKVDEIVIKDGRVAGVKAKGVTYESENVILACGHSARDTIKKLYSQGVNMSAKVFAVGARVEHSQQLIDIGQYGNTKGLPAADYKLSHRLSSGSGCFTFCMCPGGYVMPSMSEKNTVVTNGMSENKRDSGFANSAVLVGIEPKDYGDGVLDGFDYQQRLERLAFDIGKSYAAPAVKVSDFIDGKVTKNIADIKSTYARGLECADFQKVFDKKVVDGMREGLVAFGKKINGFDKNGILIGVESRSSSPVRIDRDDKGMSNIVGLYPSGEGAGFAGGITSSAVDGIKTALKLVQNNKQ